MKQQQGFSLIEVLLSLMLVSVTALGLLEQQWKSLQLVQQIDQRSGAITELDNASEYFYSRMPPKSFQDESYHLQIKPENEGMILEISWQPKADESPQKPHRLRRLLFRDS